jgi:16S rRNA (guanine527-N7)-methyltransferase
MAMKGKTDIVWGRVLEELGEEAAPPGNLRAYVDELVKWGERIHLTGRERMADAIAAQISDSMVMLELAGEGTEVADIGTGAGFPGIVWKLARPRLEIVLFERKERLASFLERTAAILGLEGVSVRAEDAALYPEARRFDIVTSKAAGRLGEILPVAGRMLKKGGIYVTAKGEGWEAELEGISAGFSPGGRVALRGNRGDAVALVLDR